MTLSINQNCYWALLLTALAALAGCRSEPDTSQVVAYVSVDRKDAEPILAEFTQRTGIRVHAVYDAELSKTTLLVSRLIAESKRPRCDVFWNNENVQTLMLAKRGLLQPYQSTQAAAATSQWCDEDGRWAAVATRARVIVYNRELVSEHEAPRTLQALTGPKWRAKVAIANPQFGTTRTHIAALRAVLGQEKAEQFLKDLLSNDVRIVDGNAMVKNLVARADPGASPILVGLTDSDDVVSGLADGEPIAMIYPDQDDRGTLVVPSTVCMVRGGPNPKEAKRLMDFLAGGEAGRLLAQRNPGYRPVRSDDSDPAGDPEIKAIVIHNDDLLSHLQPSTEWTAKNFHP